MSAQAQAYLDRHTLYRHTLQALQTHQTTSSVCLYRSHSGQDRRDVMCRPAAVEALLS